MKEVKLMDGLKKILVCLGLATSFMIQPALADSPAPVAAAKAAVGTIVGIVRDSAKQPVTGGTVTAVRTDGSGVRATVSDGNGMYSFPDLPSGSWSLTFQADGHTEATAPAVSVAANQATRIDMVLAGAGTSV